MILTKLCGISCHRTVGIILKGNNERISQNYLRTFRNMDRRGGKRISGQGPIGKGKGIVPTPFDGIKVETGPVPFSNIKKSILFAFAFSTCSFLGVSIWEYESVRAKVKDKKHLNFLWFKNEMNRKKADWKEEIASYWNRLRPGEKVFVPICLLNLLVFGMWRIPRCQPIMIKYFSSNPSARVVCWPMLLSTFSHYSFFHLFANMYVLHSFSNVAVSVLGKEQFLGLYLSAGVISTMTSYLYKATTGVSGLSLGASGAIMAVLAFVCTEYPDTRLSILFLPIYTFAAGTAIKVIMALDFTGCIVGWKFFDHAAHLGGALFGLFWCFIGKNMVWPEREHFIKIWHQLRSMK